MEFSLAVGVRNAYVIGQPAQPIALEQCPCGWDVDLAVTDGVLSHFCNTKKSCCIFSPQVL